MSLLHRPQTRLAMLPALALVSVFAAGPTRADESLQLAQMSGSVATSDRCERLAERVARTDRKLTADQIRDIVAGRLAERGEGTLKVGKVRESAPGVVAVDIVTTSGNSLVVTREISTKTGLAPDVVAKCENRAAARERAGQTADQRGPGRGERRMARMRGDGFGMRGNFADFALVADRGNRDLNLTTDQAKKLADAAVIMMGNPRLKVGTVKEKDADTVTVDIVTQDNALVMRREVDRHTGRMRRAS
jgi:hypothetical protein